MRDNFYPSGKKALWHSDKISVRIPDRNEKALLFFNTHMPTGDSRVGGVGAAAFAIERTKHFYEENSPDGWSVYPPILVGDFNSDFLDSRFDCIVEKGSVEKLFMRKLSPYVEFPLLSASVAFPSEAPPGFSGLNKRCRDFGAEEVAGGVRIISRHYCRNSDHDAIVADVIVNDGVTQCEDGAKWCTSERTYMECTDGLWDTKLCPEPSICNNGKCKSVSDPNACNPPCGLNRKCCYGRCINNLLTCNDL